MSRLKGSFAALLALLFVGSWAGVASAHAVVVGTDPSSDTVVDESPERVTATFNEPVEVAFGALRVYDTEGTRVDEDDSAHLGGNPRTVSVRLQPDLKPGTYTATYRVVSADGHPVEAAFVFHVERPGEQPQGIGETLLSGEGGSGSIEQVLYGIARWVLFAGLMLLIGTVGFLIAVWARRSGTPRRSEIDERFMPRWRRLVRLGWWTTFSATFVAFVLQGAVAADLSLLDALSPNVASELAGTRYGQVALVRLLTLIMLAVVWVVGTRASAARAMWPLRPVSTVGAEAAHAPLSRVPTITAALLLVVLAATPGLSGHAGATPPVWLNVTADTLHVVAAGVWIGGLVTLLGCAYRAAAGSAVSDRVASLGPIVSRYSDVAMICVALLVITGTYRTWIEVQALRAFVEAPYGWVLLTKLGVFVPLLTLGALNNRVLKPRIDRAVDEASDDASALATLRRVVTAEVALGVVVLAVTALLVNLPPARVDAGVTGPFIDDIALGQNNLNIVVDPNQVGENLIHLTATTPGGTAVEIKSMKVRFSMPADDVGPITAEGKQVGPGHFVVQGRQLSIPGDWLLEIEARIDKYTNQRAEVKVTVNR